MPSNNAAMVRPEIRLGVPPPIKIVSIIRPRSEVHVVFEIEQQLRYIVRFRNGPLASDAN